MNIVCLIGRLTKDVELKYSQSGTAFGSFTVAVNRQFKNQNGESETDFIPVKVFRNTAENCKKYIGKGSLVSVEGRMQIDRYEDRDGNTKYSTSVMANNVTFLESKKDRENNISKEDDIDPTKLTDEDLDRYFGRQDLDEDDLPF